MGFTSCLDANRVIVGSVLATHSRLGSFELREKGWYMVEFPAEEIIINSIITSTVVNSYP